MATAESTQARMIIPPDGKQTRIDFFKEKSSKKHTGDWWHSISSWFRHEDRKHGPDLEFYERQLQKEGYSEKSRSSYLFMMKRFFNYYPELDANDITMGEIEDYNFEFFVSGRYSRSYQLQFINALKLYYALTRGVELNLKHLRKTDNHRK
ncbi:MAG: phage integrase N-terminal SAM-like domain-containing protein [Bacteroidales bacterium]